jgi:hypothetical protein
MDDRERQLEIEGAQRHKIATISVASGAGYLVVLLLFGVIISAKLPTVGLLQGLAPALHGLKQAGVDPRSSLAVFEDHHVIVAALLTVLSLVAVAALRWPLSYLHRAAVLRGGQPGPVVAWVANYVPPIYAVVDLVAFAADQIGIHKFVTHAVKTTAAYQADTGGGVRIALATLAFIGTAALGIAWLMIAMRAMRVGLLTKLLGWLGVAAGFLFILPIVPLPLIQFLWLAGLAMVLVEFGGLKAPPAWAAGEAIPWPSGADLRAQRAADARRSGGRAGSRTAAPSAPAIASSSASKKRKRRRG